METLRNNRSERHGHHFASYPGIIITSFSTHHVFRRWICRSGGVAVPHACEAHVYHI